jgi:hypothetical protein
MEKFMEYCVDDEARILCEQVQQIVTARKHRAFQPETEAHKRFLITHWEKTRDLKEKYPFLQLEEEMNYFKGSGV